MRTTSTLACIALILGTVACGSDESSQSQAATATKGDAFCSAVVAAEASGSETESSAANPEEFFNPVHRGRRVFGTEIVPAKVTFRENLVARQLAGE